MTDVLGEVFALGILAGLLSLDATAVMLSVFARPLVAGPLAGAILGNWQAGLAVGTLLELLSLTILPVGSLVPPDATLASIVATAVAVWSGRWGLTPEAAGALGVFLSAGAALWGARAETMQRHWMDKVSQQTVVALEQGDETALGRAVKLGLLAIVTRGALAAWIALGLVVMVGPGLVSHLANGVRLGLAWCWWVLFAGGLACLLDFFWERRHLRWSMIGAGVTVLAAYILRLSPMAWWAWLVAACIVALLWERRASLPSKRTQ